MQRNKDATGRSHVTLPPTFVWKGARASHTPPAVVNQGADKEGASRTNGFTHLSMAPRTAAGNVGEEAKNKGAHQRAADNHHSLG